MALAEPAPEEPQTQVLPLRPEAMAVLVGTADGVDKGKGARSNPRAATAPGAVKS